MKREKRIKKGIDSLEEQKKIHLEKKKLAEEIGNENLVRYYEKEIESLQKRKNNREDKLKKK